jgi:hypothetical protein
MKRFFALFLIGLTGSFVSCDLFEPSFLGTWKVTKIEANSYQKASKKIYQDVFLSFYENGTYSYLNKNEASISTMNSTLGERMEEMAQPTSKLVYKTGKWSKQTSSLLLVEDNSGIKTEFNIKELDSDWLTLQIARGAPNTEGALLKCQPSQKYINQDFDLLSPEANKWQMKPTKKESEQEIKSRVLQHLDFLIQYFKLVEDKEQGYFEIDVLRTPFQFYANGLGVMRETESVEIWRTHFYDTEDANLGADMLMQGLRSIDAYPSDSKSYTKGYLRALLLIKKHVEK